MMPYKGIKVIKEINNLNAKSTKAISTQFAAKKGLVEW